MNDDNPAAALRWPHTSAMLYEGDWHRDAARLSWEGRSVYPPAEPPARLSLRTTYPPVGPAHGTHKDAP